MMMITKIKLKMKNIGKFIKHSTFTQYCKDNVESDISENIINNIERIF